MMADNKRKIIKRIIIIALIVAIALVAFFILYKKGIINFQKEEEESVIDAEISEKYSIVGCIKYTDFYMYFDQDGVVRMSSPEKDENIPLVLGLNFDHVAINDELDIANEDIFRWLLEVVQTLNKYEIKFEKIYISSDYEMTLYIANVKVELGKNEYTAEKIAELSNFYDKLVGLSGTLFMQDFDLNNKTFTFKSNQ
ncbi:MAG: cell division protein FtsQ/DivIB [Parasporobacterium sp.]|nr:cell division protein FtsQ/DivIB [Parasporobacterium sp.]